MANELYIDGVDYSEFVDLKEVSLSYGFNDEDNTYIFQKTNALVFTSDAYEYICKSIVNDCRGSLSVRFYECCCGDWYEFLILPTDVSMCPSKCEVEVTLTSYDEDVRKYDCLNNEQIWLSDDFRQAGLRLQFPRVGETDIQPVGWYSGWLIRDILQWHADRCGANLKAPIFTDPSSPYFNAVIIPKGVESPIQLPANSSNNLQYTTESVTELLDRLGVLMNSEQRLVNCEWCFDTVKSFEQEIYAVIDLDKIATEDDICFSLDKEKYCAYLRLQYAEDPLDKFSSEALNVGNYRDLISYTSGSNPAFSGECTASSDFAIQGKGINPQLLIEGEEIQNDRLVIWFDGSPVDNAIVENFNCAPNQTFHNLPFWANLNPNFPTTDPNCKTLYQNFWEDCIPSRPDFCPIKLDNFCICFETKEEFCEAVNDIRNHKFDIAFKQNICGKEVVVKPDPKKGEITIRFGENQICYEDLSNIIDSEQ